ncbi:Hypothetical predicted protein [Mytilus galloprovincialis]|uniref:G-protein coupled receptors family 1 profile domain-containing protein n=1 Tax=Mytilus galloprovincialis TaxID=29158 RepID=A0A8B6EUG9_MYTGA|nr:Hypothetical predicted protein [Mytilus galloprovincialis]
MFGFSSTFLLAVITLQWYFKVCRPFGPQLALKARRISLLVIFFLSVSVSAPFIIMRKQLRIPNIELNVTGYKCGINIMKVDQNAYRAFIFYPSFIIVGVMLELIIPNLVIGRQMKIASKMCIDSVSIALADTDLKKNPMEPTMEIALLVLMSLIGS